MRGSDITLEELPARIPMRPGVEIPVLVCFYPELINRDSPCVFLANGFSANEKTWTFRPFLSYKGFGISIMDYFARLGFVVVLKNTGSRRTELEPDFTAHTEHVAKLVSGVVGLVSKVVRVQAGGKYLFPPGVHWVGHSLGGMEVMPAKNRDKMLTFTAIASPTYMEAYDLTVRLAALFMGRIVGLHRYQKALNLPINHFGRISNRFFKILRVRSGARLTHDQELVINMLMHLPGFHIISHVFLNLDHLDLETTVAFFRSALSDETLYLMVEFAEHVLKGEKSCGKVLGNEIAPFDIPTLVISGGGDNIAPSQSCENLIQYVKHPHRYAFTFDEYDHVGLLARHSAQHDIWPIIAAFILENNAIELGNRVIIGRTVKKVRQMALDDALGHKSRGFANDSWRRLEKYAEK